MRGSSRLAGLLTAGIVLTIVSGCGKKPDADPGANPAGSGAKVEAPAPGTAVLTQPVITKDISKTVEVTGSLTALQDVVVGAKIPGKIATVTLREGDVVRAGQVVATIDAKDIYAQIQQGEAALLSAKTREDQALAQLAQAKTAVVNAQTTLAYTEKTTRNAIQSAESLLSQSKERLTVVKQGARDQERRQAEEQVRGAKANYDKARSDLKRYQQLYKDEAISLSQLEQAQSTFDSMESSYNSAKENLSLVKEGARQEDIRQAELAVTVSQRGLERAQADKDQIKLKQADVDNAKSGIKVAEAGVATAKAGVDQAEASLKLTKQSLADCSIISPISGIVAERKAEPGAQVGAGGPVMRIVSPDSVYFQATLSESQYKDIKVGQSVKVTVDAIPGKEYAGSVTRINPVASSARSFAVRVDFKADSSLRPQMFARGNILITTHKNATLVPKDAVVYDAGGTNIRVFVLGANGTAEERKILPGFYNPQHVEVLSGVKAGEKVITQGQATLQNGDKVKPE